MKGVTQPSSNAWIKIVNRYRWDADADDDNDHTTITHACIFQAVIKANSRPHTTLPHGYGVRISAVTDRMIVMKCACLGLVLALLSSVQSRHERKSLIHENKFKTSYDYDDDNDDDGTVEAGVTDTTKLWQRSTELNSKFVILERSFEKLEVRPGKKSNSTPINNNSNNNRNGYNNVKVQKKKKRSPKCIHAKCQCKTFKGKPVTANCHGAFRVLPHFLELPTVLKEVSLRGGNLTSIGPSAFRGFRTRKLDLSGNNFRYLKVYDYLVN